MARAKSTARAAARRRYRATQAELERPDAAGEDADADAGAEPKAPGRDAAGSPSRTSFLSSIRRPDVRADLRAMPVVLRERPYLLIPFGLVLVGVVIAIASPPGAGGIGALLVSQLLYQPMLLYFAVGFLMPRGSYLLGAVLGLFSAVCYAALAIGNLGIFGTATGLTGDVLGSLLVFVGIQVFTGAVFSGFASWYRAFLRNTQARGRQNTEARKKAERREARRPAARSTR